VAFYGMNGEVLVDFMALSVVETDIVLSFGRLYYCSLAPYHFSPEEDIPFLCSASASVEAFLVS
jgi:hypothetical protein